MDLREEFNRLYREADNTYMAGEANGIPDLEPFGFKLFKLIEEHPDDKDLFINLFCESPSPWELTAFCMHTLRWPEVSNYLSDKLSEAHKANDWRSIPVFSHILESFQDNWEDKDLFPHYSNT